MHQSAQCSDTSEECHPGGGGSVGEKYCPAKCIEGKQCHLRGGGLVWVRSVV